MFEHGHGLFYLAKMSEKNLQSATHQRLMIVQNELEQHAKQLGSAHVVQIECTFALKHFLEFVEQVHVHLFVQLLHIVVQFGRALIEIFLVSLLECGQDACESVVQSDIQNELEEIKRQRIGLNLILFELSSVSNRTSKMSMIFSFVS